MPLKIFDSECPYLCLQTSPLTLQGDKDDFLDLKKLVVHMLIVVLAAAHSLNHVSKEISCNRFKKLKKEKRVKQKEDGE